MASPLFAGVDDIVLDVEPGQAVPGVTVAGAWTTGAATAPGVHGQGWLHDAAAGGQAGS